MNSPVIFISHSSYEKEFAKEMKKFIGDTFLNCDVFVSSEDISSGKDWKEVVFSKLKDSILMIALISKNSILKPWVAYEVGAAWALGIKVILVTHSGMEIKTLPEPFSIFQACSYDIQGLKSIVNSISETLNYKKPFERDFKKWEKQLNKKINRSESIPCEIIYGEENIYRDAEELVKKATKKIRVTGIGDVKTPQKRTKNYLKYANTLVKTLKSSNNREESVEVYVIKTNEHLPTPNGEDIFEKNGISHLRYVKELPEFPRIANVLIVDDNYMHISIPIINSDIGGLRCCLKISEQKVIKDFIDWFDNYLWKYENKK